MSETETGIIVPPNTVVGDRSGIKKWSAVFDTISIEKRPNGGRLVRANIADKAAEFDLSREQAIELSGLLCPSSNE